LLRHDESRFGFWKAIGTGLVNRQLRPGAVHPEICGSAATGLEHLILSRRNLVQRRFLAIGFLDIDGATSGQATAGAEVKPK
jgi:hypothetical protein